jgi:hypothetical protein
VPISPATTRISAARLDGFAPHRRADAARHDDVMDAG